MSEHLVSTLDAIDYSYSETFYVDFSAVLKSTHEIDRFYQLGKQEVDGVLPIMKKAIIAFNKKYRDISLTLRKKPSSLELLITFKGETDVQTFFARSASRIKGISSLGLQGFDEVSVSESEKTEKLLQRMKSKLFLTYADTETGIASFMVQKKGKFIFLTCNRKDLLTRTSPEFKLCSYYALRHPIQKKINVLNYASALGFTYSAGLENVDMQESFEPYSRGH